MFSYFITSPALQVLFNDKDKNLNHYRGYKIYSLKKILLNKKNEITKLSYLNSLLFPIIAFVILILKINFIDKFERSSPFIINYILFKIFSLEKYLLKKTNFLFRLCLIIIIKKKY